VKNLENLRQHYTQQDAETKKQLQKKFPKKPLSQINEASPTPHNQLLLSPL